MEIKYKFHKYRTEEYYYNLKKYGPPPQSPVFSRDPFPSPPRDYHLPHCSSLGFTQ